MTEESKPTGKEVAGFLTTVAARGDMNSNTAGAMKAAVKEVLGAVHGDEWQDVDVTEIDLDQYADRFARLRASNFKADSLKVYQARFKNAIGLFMEWRANPAEWKYKPKRPYKDRPKAGQQAKREQGSSSNGARSSTVIKEPNDVQMIDYPYPLRRDLIVMVRLPADLTRQEAQRLQAYIESLAFDERPALPMGNGGS